MSKKLVNPTYGKTAANEMKRMEVEAKAKPASHPVHHQASRSIYADIEREAAKRK